MEVNTVNDVLALVQDSSFSSCWFRGQANHKWELEPKFARKGFYRESKNYPCDVTYFDEWRSKACAYTTLPNDYFEMLALAQHHGLATALLDWTTNPLVALFFTINDSEQLKNDGALFIYDYTAQPRELQNPPRVGVEVKPSELHKLNKVYNFTSDAISSRILAQSGEFTVHCPPTLKIDSSSTDRSRAFFSERNIKILKINIPHKIKMELKQTLNLFGINNASLFPGLDGIANHVNSMMEEDVRLYELNAKIEAYAKENKMTITQAMVELMQ